MPAALRSVMSPSSPADEVEALGRKRAAMTGRAKPHWHDWQWLADETDGRIQGTDPADAATFSRGMREGAKEIA